jgi:hypothetical protein
MLLCVERRIGAKLEAVQGAAAAALLACRLPRIN